jgi:hypothetical protein
MPIKWLVFFVGAVALAAALATWFGARRQQRAYGAAIERLIRAGAADSTATRARSQEIADLPPPVGRYLRMALPSSRSIQQLHMRQTGRLRTDATVDRWMPFEAEHIVVPAANGFVWNARVKVAPFVHVRVRDALIGGEGAGEVNLLSAFTVSSASGGIEMNSGSLHRYLAEAVWYPTALLPSSALRWTDIDATRALATLTSYGVSVSLEFRFAESGEVTGIYTPARWGAFEGGYRQLPWEGHFRDYRERSGVVVPSEGDVGWHIENQWRAVWEGAVVSYELRTD